MKSRVISVEDIHSLISKNYNSYCVFIQPNGIVNMGEIIEEFNLPCSVCELSSEELIVEFYEVESIANQRVDKFNVHDDYFYVALYKDGEKIITNID